MTTPDQYIDIDPSEMGPDYEANKGRAIRDCTCGHRWYDHACWPTHIAGGQCFRCGCNAFEGRTR